MNIDELRLLPSFAEFPEHDLAVMSSISRTVFFPEGAAIVEQGEKARAAYFVLSGEVEVIRRLPGSTRTRLGVLRRGALFGAVALLDGGVRAASCHALTEVRTMELAAADFQRLCHASTPLGARFLAAVTRQLVRDLRATNTRIAELAGMTTLRPEDVAASVGGSLI